MYVLYVSICTRMHVMYSSSLHIRVHAVYFYLVCDHTDQLWVAWLSILVTFVSLQKYSTVKMFSKIQ